MSKVQMARDLSPTPRPLVYTTGAVAQMFGVAARTATKWFDSGRLKGYRIPGSNDRRIPLESIVDFAHAHGLTVPSELRPLRALALGLDRREVPPGWVAVDQLDLGGILATSPHQIASILIGDGEGTPALRVIADRVRATCAGAVILIAISADVDPVAAGLDLIADRVFVRPFNPAALLSIAAPEPTRNLPVSDYLKDQGRGSRPSPARCRTILGRTMPKT